MGKPGKDKNVKQRGPVRGRGRGGSSRGARGGSAGRRRLPRAAQRLDEEGILPLSVIADHDDEDVEDEGES
jgi:hypothetical protein